MGAPTLAQIHSWTDALAARLQLDITGLRSEYSAQASASLYDLVDASNDPDVETALLTPSLAVDRHSTPERVYEWLPVLTGRAAYQSWAAALKTLVISTAGGSNASLRAYLVAVSAKLHPLAGEIFRKVLGEDCFTASSVVAGVSNPTYGAIFPTRLYRGADGALAEETTDAQSATTADVTLVPTNGHSVYVGSDRPFQGVCFALSTLASEDIAATIQYFNGSAWATLTATDNTVGLTKNDIITFSAPGDWSRWYKDSGGTAFADLARLYYVRITRTAATVNTPPVGTCVTIIPTVLVNTQGGATHAGAFGQPPLAICRITGTNTIVVTAPAGVDYTRWAAPVGTENKLRARALTPIAQDLTITLAYTDGSGAATGSTAQSAWTAPAALGTKTLALTSTDALRSVRTTTSATTTATQGAFCIEAVEIRTPAI